MKLPDFSERRPHAVALDLDGTALNSESRLSSRTSTAVLTLIRLGIPIVIATARPERVISTLVGPEIAARSSLVHMSGTVGVGRRPLSGSVWTPIDPEQARLTWEVVIESPVQSRMTMEVDGRRFAVSHEDGAAELWSFNTATPDMIMSLEDALEAGPAKVSVNGLGNDLTSIVEKLQTELSDQTVVIPAVDNSFMNVHSVYASKSGAVETLVQSCGTGLEDVVSFGDDLPDIDLMNHTGWPVAVANAIDPVKQAARYHTASNDDNGVAVVLELMIEAIGSEK